MGSSKSRGAFTYWSLLEWWWCLVRMWWNTCNSGRENLVATLVGQVIVTLTVIGHYQCYGAVEFSPRIVFTKHTPWQGILGPTNLMGYGLSPGQFHPGVEIFKGIPYAAPPISRFRYEVPSPITLLSNKTYIASETKPACPKQYASLNVYKGPDVIRKLKSNLNQDALEDCLYLDIYAPRVSTKNSGPGLPVLVYANSHVDDPEDPFDGSSMAAIGNLIVVSFRYRVGVLGFLHPGYSEDIPSNFGLWDQLAALQWIRENIEGFGGDENNVSLMGFDLDASFAGILALSPLSQAYGGLFHRLILLNGSPLSPVSINHRPLETTAHMARALNCPLHEMNGELVSCLRQRHLDQLLGAAHNIGSSLFNNHFAPAVDGGMVKENLGNVNSVHADTESLKEMLGKYDILCGLAEGTILPNIGRPMLWQNLDLDTFVAAVLRLALQMEPGTNPSDSLKDELKRALINEYGDGPFIRDILADYLTVFPMTNLLNLHSQTGRNTFFYVSKNYDPLSKTKRNDISYIFSSSVYKWRYIDYGQPNADLQPYELLITFIANFVRSGDPNVQNPRERFSTTPRAAAWPKYRAEKGSYLRFGREVVVESKYRRRSMDFWIHAFPAIIKTAMSSQLNVWEPNTESRFPVHFAKPGRGVLPRGTVPGTSAGTAGQAENFDNVQLISFMTQNTVVMVAGFLLILNLCCFMGLFYQRQRLKRTELQFQRRYPSGVPAAAAPDTELIVPNGGNEGRGAAIPSDASEPYGYISASQLAQQPRAPHAVMDTMSETETDNGFGADFLGPNYDPRTKVTRWMFQQNQSRNGSLDRPEEMSMTTMVPYGTLRRPPAPAPSSSQTTSHHHPPYYNNQAFSIPSDIHYADSCATSPSVTNYKVQTPPPSFNNNLSTNNFNNPRRSFAPSPSNSGTTTISNPDSHQYRRSKAVFPLQNSVIVQEVDLEEYPNSEQGLVVTDDLQVQSSLPKLVPVKTGTLTRSVGVGEMTTNENKKDGGGSTLSLLEAVTPAAAVMGEGNNPSPAGSSSRQGPKVTFAVGI